MTLTKLENNFNTRLESLKNQINVTDTWSVVTKKPLLKKAIKFQESFEKFSKEKKVVLSDLENWKIKHMSPPRRGFQKELKGLEKESKKYKFIQSCEKAFKIAGFIFGIGGLGSINVSHHLMMSQVITASAFEIAGMAGLIIAGVGGILLIATAIIKHTSISRKIRLATSENFKDFLNNVVKIQSENYTKKDLLSSKLHNIYKHYKAAVLELPQH